VALTTVPRDKQKMAFKLEEINDLFVSGPARYIFCLYRCTFFVSNGVQTYSAVVKSQIVEFLA
jgi:hypothetical protein